MNWWSRNDIIFVYLKYFKLISCSNIRPFLHMRDFLECHNFYYSWESHLWTFCARTPFGVEYEWNIKYTQALWGAKLSHHPAIIYVSYHMCTIHFLKISRLSPIPVYCDIHNDIFYNIMIIINTGKLWHPYIYIYIFKNQF